MGKVAKAVGITATALCIGAIGFVGVSAGLAHKNDRGLLDEWKSWSEEKVVEDDETPVEDGTGAEEGTENEEGTEGEGAETLSICSNGQTVNLRYSL